MSSELDQQSIWTPPVIATIACRVVMVIVSIAFIWKKYRRPVRVLDGKFPTALDYCRCQLPKADCFHETEEQIISSLRFPAYEHPISRAHAPIPQAKCRRTINPRTLREAVSAHLEDIIQSAFKLDGEDIVAMQHNCPSTIQSQLKQGIPRSIQKWVYALESSLGIGGFDIARQTVLWARGRRRKGTNIKRYKK